MRRIPQRFQLGPHTIKVKIVTQKGMRAVCRLHNDGVQDNEDPPYGFTVFEDNLIYVQRVRRGFPKTMQMHAFWHEYFHMLFDKAGRDRLKYDETLVDSLGGLQLQAINSFHY